MTRKRNCPNRYCQNGTIIKKAEQEKPCKYCKPEEYKKFKIKQALKEIKEVDEEKFKSDYKEHTLFLTPSDLCARYQDLDTRYIDARKFKMDILEKIRQAYMVIYVDPRLQRTDIHQIKVIKSRLAITL